MLVRIATLEDSERVARLNNDLFLCHVSYHPLYRLKENASELSLAYIKDKIGKSTLGDGLVLVAQEEDIVGYLMCSIKDQHPSIEIRKMGHIGPVYVIPAYRRRGIAAALMKEALKWLKERKVEYADLNVCVENAIANAAWTAMGFKPHQRNLIKKL
ncbi:MAG: GNAT family N-acetyltransferase [Candidatus Bathyarchaeia archaeon]